MDDRYVVEALSHHFPETVSLAQFASQANTIEAVTLLLTDYERKMNYDSRARQGNMRRDSYPNRYLEEQNRGRNQIVERNDQRNVPRYQDRECGRNYGRDDNRYYRRYSNNNNKNNNNN